jgi:hypothetical protein
MLKTELNSVPHLGIHLEVCGRGDELNEQIRDRDMKRLMRSRIRELLWGSLQGPAGRVVRDQLEEDGDYGALGE